jgi:hypothetical protein
MDDDGITLVATLRWGDDERIGMRTRYKGDVGEGKHCGYLEFIEQYSDGTETWNVVEIGGAITVDTVSSCFELLPGEEKKVFAPVASEQPEELSDKQIYQLLQEAFVLTSSRMTMQDEQMKIRLFRNICTIQKMLCKGTSQWAAIEEAYLAMLEHWEDGDVQRGTYAKKTAQTIIQLRGKQ